MYMATVVVMFNKRLNLLATVKLNRIKDITCYTYMYKVKNASFHKGNSCQVMHANLKIGYT